jgi:hypothetical protein
MSNVCHFSSEVESIRTGLSLMGRDQETLRKRKGEPVKKYFVFALALLSVAGLGATARAEDGSVAVTVPFEFVAGGQTLPSGRYTISSIGSGSALKLSGQGRSAVLLPTSFNDNSGFTDTRLSFQRVDNNNLLSRVTTSAGTYTLVSGRELVRLAQTQQHKGMAAAGSN